MLLAPCAVALRARLMSDLVPATATIFPDYERQMPLGSAGIRWERKR